MSMQKLNLKENTTGIKDKVLLEMIELAQKSNLQKLVLFGSRARGDYRERSDIDLAIYGGNYARFSIDTDETTSTLLRFDFVNMDGHVQPELKEAILEEGIIIYEKV